MKKITIIICASVTLLLSNGNSFGQSIGIVVSGGVASVRMDDMKYLQEYILTTYPVEGKITSSFPPYMNFSITFFKQLYDNLRIGGAYTFSATGGKASYADYSGNITTDMSATANMLGAYLSYSLLSGDRLDLSMYGKVDANLTSLTIESYYNILSYSNGRVNKYRSISPAGNVGAELTYNFENFALGMEVGYLVDIPGKLKDNTNGDPLLDPNDSAKTLTSDWTGWNVDLGVLIWIK